MKKTIDTVLVVCVAVLTVSTTTSLIHNQSQKKHSLVPKIMHSRVSKESQTVNKHTADRQTGQPSTAQDVSPAGTPVPAAASSTSTAAPSDSSVVQNWSAADTQRFLAITDKLIHSLTPQDWSNIEQALSQGSERQAQIVLMTTAHKYLTTSDETWVATHLAGNKPFGPVDVALLQQAFKQLQAQLTPSEQQLLQENHLL